MGRIQRFHQREHARMIRRQAIALAQYQLAHIAKKTRQIQGLQNARRILAGIKIANFILRHYKK